MKLATKIGIAAIVAGAVLSAAGGIICLASPNDDLSELFGEPVSYEETFSGDISELALEASFLDIEIRTGDEFKIVAENVPERLVLSTKESEGKLKIEQDEKFESNNIKIGKIDETSTGSYIVYIPEDSLKKIDIEAAFCSMELTELQAEKLDIECSFGEYNINDSVFEKADIQSSFSDLSSAGIECGKLYYANAFGSIRAEALKITGSGDFDNSFGDMDIQLVGDNYDFTSVNTIGSVDTFTCPEEEVKLSVDVAFGDASFTN